MKYHHTYCPHLERLVGPRVGPGWKRITFSNDVNWLERQATRNETEESRLPSEYQSEMHLRAKLTKFGIIERHVEIVIDRLVKNKTYHEIALDYGYFDHHNARRAYLDALARLKKLGYK